MALFGHGDNAFRMVNLKAGTAGLKTMGYYWTTTTAATRSSSSFYGLGGNSNNIATTRSSRQQQQNLYSNSNNDPATTNALQERLEEVLLYELIKDGGQNYLTLSVRSLYKHVLAAITTTTTTTGRATNTAADSPRTAATTKIASLPPVLEEPPSAAAASLSFSQQHQFTRPSSSLSPHPPRPVTSVTGMGLEVEDPMLEPLPPTPLTTAGDWGNPETEISFQEEDDVDVEEAQRLSAAGGGGVSPATAPDMDASSFSSYYLPAPPPPFPPPPTMSTTSTGKRPLPPRPLPPLASSYLSSRKSSARRVNGARGQGDPVTFAAGADVTYRERLGGYLHPRDMRKLVMPFSASNEPELIVRRHAMLLNFDPLRCIILRDRLLVLIPDGADSLLTALERRVRGGKTEMEHAYFNDTTTTSSVSGGGGGGGGGVVTGDSEMLQPPPTTSMDDSVQPQEMSGSGLWGRVVWGLTQRSTTHENHPEEHYHHHAEQHDDDIGGTSHSKKSNSGGKTSRDISSEHLHKPTADEIGSIESSGESYGVDDGSGDNDRDDNNNKYHNEDEEGPDPTTTEWDDIAGQEWIELPFELQCADAVLQTVVGLLSDDTSELQEACLNYIEQILNGKRGNAYTSEDPLTMMRAIKDSVREMTSRVKGFVQSMNTILDDYEDMALMNLSRLITHPERFIQPVPAEILEEESDEPELILESYLQQSLSLLNALHLMQGQIDTATELVDQKLDATRNKILLANTIITTIALSVDCATLVAGIFGMNLTNHLEYNDSSFVKVTFWTLAACVVLFFVIMAVMYRTGAIPSWGGVSSGF